MKKAKFGRAFHRKIKGKELVDNALSANGLRNQVNGKQHEKKAETNKYLVKIAEQGQGWIAGAIKKPGALHSQLGISKGKKIPKTTLDAAAQKGGKLGQRARLAETLEGMHHKKAEIMENKYLTKLIGQEKQAGAIWDAVKAGMGAFAKGAVADASKLGGQMKNVVSPSGAGLVQSTKGRVMGVVKNKAFQAGAGLVGVGAVGGAAMSGGQNKQAEENKYLTMNKFLLKIAEYNYNINDNYHYDPYAEDRLYDADLANSVLVNNGYKPSINTSPSDLAMGRKLRSMNTDTYIRPNEARANGWSALAGLTTGVSAGVGTGVLTHNPLLAVLAGAGTSLVAGKLTKRLLYSDEAKRKADDAHQVESRNKLLAHLAAHYSKL